MKHTFEKIFLFPLSTRLLRLVAKNFFHVDFPAVSSALHGADIGLDGLTAKTDEGRWPP